jgi:hypothetical protein
VKVHSIPQWVVEVGETSGGVYNVHIHRNSHRRRVIDRSDRVRKRRPNSRKPAHGRILSRKPADAERRNDSSEACDAASSERPIFSDRRAIQRSNCRPGPQKYEELLTSGDFPDMVYSGMRDLNKLINLDIPVDLTALLKQK